MTTAEKIKYWISLSDKDLIVSKDMFEKRDKKEFIIDKVKQYKHLVEESKCPLKIENVYLFGSYAKGNSHEDSDIDVAFIVQNLKGNFFKVVPPIWKLREKVDFRIEPHIIARDTDYAGMIDEIEKTGVLID